MLKSWSIKNFKPIVDSGELQLAPVTVLAGRNSSGKSSLLQSILMIAQTLGSRLLDRPLLPNERIVQLGAYEDILNEFSATKVLNINFELEFEDEEFLYNSITEAVTLLEAREQYEEYDDLEEHEEPEEVTISFGKNKEVSRVSLTFKKGNRTNQSSSSIETSNIYINKAAINIMPFGVEYRNYVMLPSNFSLNFREITSQEREKIFKNILNLSNALSSKEQKSIIDDIKSLDYIGELAEYKDTFLLSLSHFLPHVMRKLPTNLQKEAEDPEWNGLVSPFEIHGGYSSLIHDFSDSITRIENFFTSKVRYLGPLRAEPGTIQQQFAPTSELDNIGIKGEYAAMVYHFNKKTLIEWYNPQTQQVEKCSLQKALDSWAHYLNIAEHIGTEEAGAIGITWQIVPQKGRKPRSLPELGVGISQLLPILVMGLLSPTNSLLIIEQPELHMHPYVQARLGDFFMGLAKCQKQCLIETHSENLVSQLRLHIVEAGGLEKSDCMVYFVDQDEKGTAKFEQVKISERGNILNWPEGFFDESMIQEDKITAASLRRRAKLAKHD